MNEVAVASTRRAESRTLTGRLVDEICRVRLLQASGEANAVLDIHGIVLGWNPEAERLTRLLADDVLGRPLGSLPGHDADRVGTALVAALATGIHVGRSAACGYDKSRLATEATTRAVRNEYGTAIGFVRTMRAVGHEHGRETGPSNNLRQLVLHLQAAVDHMAQGICLYDRDERLVFCNNLYGEILGVHPAVLEPGGRFFDILCAAFAGSDDGSVVEKVERICQARRAGLGANKPREITIGGRVVAINNRGLPDGGWVSTLDDVTERREAEKRLVHSARYDTLTGLANRTILLERLAAALSFGKASLSCALLYLDLDRFKPINDKLGHATGDAVLKIVGERITAGVRAQDLAARIGGDEFAILMECGSEPEAAALAERLIAAVTCPIELNGLQIVVGASVGIAIGPDHGFEPDVLLSNADRALYHAKGSGRGCQRFYGPELELLAREKRDFERDLRAALRDDVLALHYQPVVDMDRRVITSVEALLRWNCPQRGRVAPALFIPFAEEVGLMPEIGDWVLDTACRDAMSWPDELKVSVNLSPAQFHLPDLVDRVARALERAGLPPWRLELEVTETAMIEDVGIATTILQDLRALGVAIALDDFGTGYSSLSFLRTMPFNRIKIDRSFVQDLGIRPEALAIVRAVAGLCSSLGVAATAEGAETDAQIALLRAEGCTEIQGFGIGRPCPAPELEEWMAAFAASRPTVAPAVRIIPSWRPGGKHPDRSFDEPVPARSPEPGSAA